MYGFSLKRVFLFLALTLCSALLIPDATAQKGGVGKPAAKKQKPSAAQPQAQAQNPAIPAYQPAPLSPVPLDQVPAVAPKVNYKDGELTIVAHNSTLVDVLKAVRQQTGAELEIPSNATERVIADLGPGPARQVLADLLNGTHFNYVMVGSSTDPSAVQSIFLTPKTGVEAASSGAARPGQLPERPPATTVAEPEPPPADDTADGADNDDTPAAAEQTADQQNQQNPGQQTPKTPEQLLQELQRQQQQQQQQQQNGQPPQGILPNQPPTTAPPNQRRPE
jgi:hypothetical protein